MRALWSRSRADVIRRHAAGALHHDLERRAAAAGLAATRGAPRDCRSPSAYSGNHRREHPVRAASEAKVLRCLCGSDGAFGVAARQTPYAVAAATVHPTTAAWVVLRTCIVPLMLRRRTRLYGRQEPSPTAVVSPEQRAQEYARIIDTEIVEANLVEDKYSRLSRSRRRFILDREAKPSSEERNRLMSMRRSLQQRQLRKADADLVWQYRYFLARQKGTVLLFVSSIDWQDPYQVQQTVAMLKEWNYVEVDDALGLLGSPAILQHPAIMQCALSSLEHADDDELLMYLLQFVQVLKSTMHDNGRAGVPETASSTSAASANVQLANFLLSRAARNVVFANALSWYLRVEMGDEAKLPGAITKPAVYWHMIARDDFSAQLSLMEELAVRGRSGRRSGPPRRTPIVATSLT